jgi:hypothetical protein
MGDGGRPHAQLTHLHERFALSLHGVGLSIGVDGPLDRAHLQRLRRLCDRYRPESFSEHLAVRGAKVGAVRRWRSDA